MKEATATRSRIRGALVGLAIGDALGAPVEHMERRAIFAKYPSGIHGYLDDPASGLRPGQGTDDTEMALLVADSIGETRALDMPDVVRRLVAWGTDHPSLGPSTGAGIAALARGVPWQEAGQTAVASSGCLPRCAPVALIAESTQVVAETVRCCIPTHRHPLAVAATVAQNLVLEGLVRGLPWEEALSAITEAPHPVEQLATIQLAIEGGFSAPGAVDVLVEALRCVDGASSADSAVIEAVLMGGDTDTRGAVAGMLAGARWGHSGFSRHLIDGCEAHQQADASGEALANLRVADERTRVRT